MPNQRHLAEFKKGVKAWNKWRKSYPSIKPDLSKADLNEADLSEIHLLKADLSGASLTKANLRGADLHEVNFSGATLSESQLSGANLGGANLSGADLREADLRGACLIKADARKTVFTRANLSGADLREADLREASLIAVDLSDANVFRTNLSGADLCGANLQNANLFRANLREAYLREANLAKVDLRGADMREANLHGAVLNDANLSEANLSEANLSAASIIQASLVGTNLEGADLTGCSVYGISVWNARLDRAKQSNLLITPEDEPSISVDSLEVAQFVYLLLNNAKIRQVIDTIGRKAVLILGRFTPERKAVLDSIREALRRSGYLPIMFDFETPSTRDTHETIVTLAGLSRFVIADITDPKSIPQELVAIVPALPSVPVQPLLQCGHKPWGMFDHIRRYASVLPLLEYDNTTELLQDLKTKVIAPAEEKAKELSRR